MKKNLITTLGFVLFIVGFCSLFLSIVGIRFYALAFLDSLGPGFSLISKITMIIFGFVLIYVGKSNEIIPD